jgi:hypothetical protein
MNEIMSCGGENDYKIPHICKDCLCNKVGVPLLLGVTKEAWPSLKDMMFELNLNRLNKLVI